MLRLNLKQGAYYTILILLGRAQKRVTQQRIDSKMEMGRIVDIRKRVFDEVKVCPFVPYFSRVTLKLASNRNTVILALKLATTVQFRKFASLRTRRYLLPVVGQEQFVCGMYRLAPRYVHFEGMLIVSVASLGTLKQP